MLGVREFIKNFRRSGHSTKNTKICNRKNFRRKMSQEKDTVEFESAQFELDEKWVQNYIEQFGEEASFF